MCFRIARPSPRWSGCTTCSSQRRCSRLGSWLLLCILLCGFAWRRRETPEGAFVLGVCGSAAVYVLSFSAVGVASDFRYGYWAVLAGIAGGACPDAYAGARLSHAKMRRPTCLLSAPGAGMDAVQALVVGFRNARQLFQESHN